MDDQRPILIYDGECGFCRAWLSWLKVRVQVEAHAFQEAKLDEYGLTKEECAEAVHVVIPGRIYQGAAAIAYLLGLRGNRKMAFVIRAAGPLARFGYRLVAKNRNSWTIRMWTRFLERGN
jgi:predicted DCC family thiol-disulfide oxidoreductase YuxK